MQSLEIDPVLGELLEPDEQIVWWGRPSYRYFRSEAWAAFVFGLIPLAASMGAGFITVMLIRQAVFKGEIAMLLGLPIIMAPVIGFGFVAFEALATPWTCPARLRQSFYAITNKRVIVYKSVGYNLSDMVPNTSEPLYFFSPEQALGRTMTHHRSGRVDLVLAHESQGFGRHRHQVAIGILGLEDWQDAERAIQKTFCSMVPVVVPIRSGARH